MSKRSKIIRTIIAMIFLLTLCAVITIVLLDNSKIKADMQIEFKLLYACTLILSIVVYVFLKNKLTKMNINKNLEYIYRYIYLFLITVGTRTALTYIYQKNMLDKSDKIDYTSGIGEYIFNFVNNLNINTIYFPIIFNILLVFLIAAFIKRIMFNITVNEILSTIASIIYLFMPLGIISSRIYTTELINTLFITLAIYITLKMIDEVKQHKLNSKKYIFFALAVTGFAALDLAIGGSIYMFTIIAMLTMTIGDNIDFIQINFKKSFVDKFDIKIKKTIYKIERMKISKLIIGNIVICLLLLILGAVVSLITKNNIFTIPMNININDVLDNIKANFVDGRSYYMVVFISIVILEILGKILNRKKDTKSTYLKIVLIVTLVISSLNSNTYSVYIIDVVASILLVLNLGNIYYNREEKIKLLK